MQSIHAAVSTEIIRPKKETKSPQNERRGRERLKCKRRPMVRVCAKPERKVYRALIRDATRQGLGIIMERGFEVGTGLAIRLDPGQTDKAAVLMAEVRHSSQLSDGSWLVGCSLARELSAFELFSLV
jgi:hypothetical protein